MSGKENPLGSGLSGAHPSAAGVFAKAESIFLTPAPIERSWILSGEPQARAGGHSGSADGGASTSVWDCTAGTFKWDYGWDETVFIFEGGVKVTSPDGKTTELKAGDVGYFPAGTTWKWEVDTYVRKLAFCRRPASKPDRLIRAVRQKMREHRTAIRMAIGVAAAATAAVYALE